MSIDYREMKQAIGLNWYRVDPNLALNMDRLLDAADRDWVEDKLRAMGELIGTTVAENAEITDKHPAELVRWNRDGEEINQVVHNGSALETKRLLWKHDFLHLPWSDEARARGRSVPAPLMFAYQYLLSQAETGMLCSIGMTTGVLRLVERYGDEATRQMFLPRLKDNDFDRGWDGSMYLTERAGGSDLGTTETVARLVDGEWKLNGFKWFCSNVDGRAMVTLARPEGAPDGIKGLALFALSRTLPDGTPNGLHIRRIKDKLGTRAVPTGEIDMVDATAHLLAGGGDAVDGKGINRMMEFVNESRMGVAAMGAGIMRRSFLEAAIRAWQRQAFGKPLAEHGMVRTQLIDLQVASEAAAAMLFTAASRMPEEGQAIGTGDPLGRILVPLTKMRCTRGGIESASAALELHGGNGYIEDWPMARQLRDAQCHTIWEGAENVIALDVLRTIAREHAHEALLERIDRARAGADDPLLAEPVAAIDRLRGHVFEELARLAAADRATANLRARRFANLFADLTQVALLVEEARWQLDRGDARKAVVAHWFARTRLAATRPAPTCDAIAMELFEPLTQYQPIDRERARRAMR